MKEKKYQLSTFVGKRKNLGATLQRKSTIINNGNLVPVREELSQLDNLFKIIEDTRKEMINLDKAIYSEINGLKNLMRRHLPLSIWLAVG